MDEFAGGARRLATYRRTWAREWNAGVVSLDDAGADVTPLRHFSPPNGRVCARRT